MRGNRKCSKNRKPGNLILFPRRGKLKKLSRSGCSLTHPRSMTSELLIQSVTALTSILKTTNDRLYEVEKLVAGLQKENEALKVAQKHFRAKEYGTTASSLACYITVDPNGNCDLYPTEDEALERIEQTMFDFGDDAFNYDGKLREIVVEELAKFGKTVVGGNTYLLKKDTINPEEHTPSGSESQFLKKFRDSSERRQKIDEIKNSIRECIEPI